MKIDAHGEHFKPASEASPKFPSFQLKIDAVSMVRRGAAVGETARAFGVSASSVRRWVKRARESGMETLASPSRGGKPPGLARDQLKGLQNDIQRAPAQFGYAGEQWSGALIARHLKNRYRINITDRQGRRILSKLSPKESTLRQAKSARQPFTRSGFDSNGSERRARPAWDGLNKEIALRRIKRLASSGLALEPFVRTLFKLINEGVPNAPNRPFLVGRGNRPDAYVGDTQEVYAIIPEHQYFYVHSLPDISGLSVPFGAHTFERILPAKPTWLLEEFMLPHFYRSEGFNQVFRRLGYHHMVHAIFLEHGSPAGFYPIWRSADQPPFSREDIRFLHAIIPHVAHGLKAARLLTSNSGDSEGRAFTPLDRWGSGVVLMDAEGHVIAADECARSLFGYLERFDVDRGTEPRKCATIADALQYIAGVLK